LFIRLKLSVLQCGDRCGGLPGVTSCGHSTVRGTREHRPDLTQQHSPRPCHTDV
jgi:hypothetical protein